MTSYGYIIVDSCIISFNLNFIMQLKQFYYIATKVSSRKKCYYFWWSTWLFIWMILCASVSGVNYLVFKSYANIDVYISVEGFATIFPISNSQITITFSGTCAPGSKCYQENVLANTNWMIHNSNSNFSYWTGWKTYRFYCSMFHNLINELM